MPNLWNSIILLCVLCQQKFYRLSTTFGHGWMELYLQRNERVATHRENKRRCCDKTPFYNSGNIKCRVERVMSTKIRPSSVRILPFLLRIAINTITIMPLHYPNPRVQLLMKRTWLVPSLDLYNKSWAMDLRDKRERNMVKWRLIKGRRRFEYISKKAYLFLLNLRTVVNTLNILLNKSSTRYVLRTGRGGDASTAGCIHILSHSHNVWLMGFSKFKEVSICRKADNLVQFNWGIDASTIGPGKDAYSRMPVQGLRTHAVSTILLGVPRSKGTKHLQEKMELYGGWREALWNSDYMAVGRTLRVCGREGRVPRWVVTG